MKPAVTDFGEFNRACPNQSTCQTMTADVIMIKPSPNPATANLGLVPASTPLVDSLWRILVTKKMRLCGRLLLTAISSSGFIGGLLPNSAFALLPSMWAARKGTTICIF
jgi:hypothetical protein